MSTDPAPSAEAAAVRAAMTQLAKLWEAAADNLERTRRHPSEVETLRGCAFELRSKLRAGRPGAQSSGAGPALDVDPLGHVVVGDQSPWPVGSCCEGEMRTPTGRRFQCTRQPHPREWQHIASGLEQVLAVWTDESQPGSAD